MNIIGDDRKALQSIMESAIGNITARTCRILDSVQNDEDSDKLTWRVEHGLLSLEAFGHRSWVGQRSDDFPTRNGTDDRRPSLKVFTDIAVRADIPIIRVDLANGSRILSFGSKEGKDIIGDDIAASFAESLGTDAVVDRATALIEKKPVAIDFSTGTSFGRSNARLKASNLLWTAWTMLGDLTKTEWASFSSTIRRFDGAYPEDIYLGPGWLQRPLRAGNRPSGELTASLVRLRSQLAHGVIPETKYREAAGSGDLGAMLLLGMLLEEKGENIEAEM